MGLHWEENQVMSTCLKLKHSVHYNIGQYPFDITSIQSAVFRLTCLTLVRKFYY